MLENVKLTDMQEKILACAWEMAKKGQCVRPWADHRVVDVCLNSIASFTGGGNAPLAKMYLVDFVDLAINKDIREIIPSYRIPYYVIDFVIAHRNDDNFDGLILRREWKVNLIYDMWITFDINELEKTRELLKK